MSDVVWAVKVQRKDDRRVTWSCSGSYNPKTHYMKRTSNFWQRDLYDDRDAALWAMHWWNKASYKACLVRITRKPGATYTTEQLAEQAHASRELALTEAEAVCRSKDSVDGDECADAIAALRSKS